MPKLKKRKKPNPKKQLKAQMNSVQATTPQAMIEHYEALLKQNNNQKQVVESLLRGYLQTTEVGNSCNVAKMAAEKFTQDVIVLKLAALVLAKSQQFESAEKVFLQVLALLPNDAETLNNYAYACYQNRDLAQAIKLAELALATTPEYLATIYNLSQFYLKSQQLQKALALLQQYHQKYSNDIKIIFNLAVLHKNHGDWKQAETLLQKVLQQQGDFVPALVLMADLYKMQDKIEQADDLIEKILKIDPNHVDAYLLKASIVLSQHHFEEALALYKKCLALETKPNPLVLGRIVRAAREVCDWETINVVEEKIRALKDELPRLEPMIPFDAVMLNDDLSLQLVVAKRMSSFKKLGVSQVFNPGKYSHSKVRIGYISPDFSRHAVGLLLHDLLQFHDRKKVKVYVFPTKRYNDTYYQAILAGADQVTDLTGLPPNAAAAAIHQAEIDILIDFAGYTQNENMSVLAHRPAPMQCHWLGYPGTLGADYVDYYIGDPVLVPANTQDHFQEKLLYIDHEYATNGFGEIHMQKIRADYQLPEDQFIFCCHHRPYRICQKTAQAWFEILKRVPKSVLWLSGLENEAKARFLAAAQKAGLTPARFVFSEAIRLTEHWAHLLADVWLDTFLMTGGTSVALCQWGGLPVVSKAGQSLQTRVAASVCEATGMRAQIVDSEQDYIELAVKLATEKPFYQALQEKIISNKGQAALYQPKAWMQMFEQRLIEAYMQQ